MSRTATTIIITGDVNDLVRLRFALSQKDYHDLRSSEIQNAVSGYLARLGIQITSSDPVTIAYSSITDEPIPAELAKSYPKLRFDATHHLIDSKTPIRVLERYISGYAASEAIFDERTNGNGWAILRFTGPVSNIKELHLKFVAQKGSLLRSGEHVIEELNSATLVEIAPNAALFRVRELSDDQLRAIAQGFPKLRIHLQNESK